MVYFGKKQGGGTPSANTATKDGNNVFTGNNIFNNPVSVGNPVSNSDAANKEYVDNAVNGCAKLASANTFSQVNTFNENVNVLLDKPIQMGYDTGSIKLKLQAVSGSNNGSIIAPIGDLIVNEGSTGRVDVKTDIVLNNKYIGNLHDPNTEQDAANKRYVDNTIAGTYASNLLTTNIRFDNIQVKVKKIPMQAYTNDQDNTLISNFNALLGYTVQRKRNDNSLFYVHPDMNTFQLFKRNNDFILWSTAASGWTNEYEFTFIYI